MPVKELIGFLIEVVFRPYVGQGVFIIYHTLVRILRGGVASILNLIFKEWLFILYVCIIYSQLKGYRKKSYMGMKWKASILSHFYQNKKMNNPEIKETHCSSILVNYAGLCVPSYIMLSMNQQRITLATIMCHALTTKRLVTYTITS